MTPEEKLDKFRRLQSAFKKDSRIKTCFHFNQDECRGKIKQSHSLQRNGRLSILESEVNGNNSLYTFTSFTSTPQRVIEDLVPIGKKEASTFFGFCDYHDTTLFSPIENFKFDNSDKHLFLHSYRSFAHSHHRKLEEFNVFNNHESEYTKLFPASFVAQHLYGLNMAVLEGHTAKSKLDTALASEDFGYLQYLVYEKEGLYPFAVSSQFSPSVSYKNLPMNNHMDPDVPYSQPIITLLPDVDSTMAIIACFPDDEKAINLLDELENLSDLQLEKAITSLIIANCENTFFSPLVWNSLTPPQRRLLINEFVDNTKTDKYNKRFFHSNFNFFSSRFEITEVDPKLRTALA